MCGDFHPRVYYDTLYAVFYFLKNVLPSQPQRSGLVLGDAVVTTRWYSKACCF